MNRDQHNYIQFKIAEKKSLSVDVQKLAVSGFTRIDLICCIILTCLLFVFFGVRHTGERARITTCKQNLHLLGKLMQSYANEHNQCLPPASVDDPQIAWDMQIAPYLSPSQTKNGFDLIFCCPSDTLSRRRPRSYAMIEHNMKPENWPPGPNNHTGVGLRWNKDNIRQLAGEKALGALRKKNFDMLLLVKVSGIPVPSDTAILTELADRDNNLKSNLRATVASPGEQRIPFNGDALKFHNGNYNYLMGDGHVELLSPLETGSLDGSEGIWTIAKDD